MTFAYRTNTNEKYDSRLIALLSSEQSFIVLCLDKIAEKVSRYKFLNRDFLQILLCSDRLSLIKADGFIF